MKICHITSVHDSLDDRIFLKECVSAASAGYDVSIVAQGRSFTRDGVKIKGIGQKGASRIQRMLFFARNIYKEAILVDADIYQFHDPELLPYGLKLKKKGKTVIYDSHEDVPRQIMAKEWLPMCVRKTVSRCFEKYEKGVAKKLDCVVTATPHIQNVFERQGVRAVAIRNYPIIEDIKGENDNYCERNNILCYAGGLTRQRGITEIVQAMEFIDGKLYMAGDMEKSYRVVLESQKAWRKVVLKGFLDREGICRLYNQSRIGLAVLLRTPNHVNALAIKLFEYMAAGIPIICSDFPLWIEIVEKNKCGICVSPEEPKKIEEAIQYLLEHEDIAKKMGDCGKRIVVEKYNWLVEEKRLLKLYETIKQ